jgi:ABC-type branched-subunit amino acid transport system ATPase component/predicted MFS family arabinose efflux permease
LRESDRQDPAALAAGILAEEERRGAERSAGDLEPLGDGALPGLRAAPVAWRAALRTGGPGLLAVITLLHVADELPRVALAVLGPDIQETFDVSDTALAGIASLGGVVLVLSTIPTAWLGDRVRRTRVIAAGAVLSGIALTIVGLARNVFQMGCGVAANGLGQATHLPNGQSLLADAYPIEARSRVYAAAAMGRPLGQVLGPFALGAAAAAAGGLEGWRWAFFACAAPTAVLALAAIVLRDPPRGQFEQQAVLGTLLAGDERPPPVAVSAAFQRLKKVKTFYYLVVGIGTLGFALVAVPLLVGLLLEDEYGYGAYTRGWMLSIAWAGALVSIPIAGVAGDRLFARDPRHVLRMTAGLVAGYGAFVVLALRFDEPVLLLGSYLLANACQGAALLSIGPVIAAVVPFSMRSQAFALVGVYVFLMGGFFGGLLAGGMSDAWGERTALTVLVPPAAALGAALILHGARFMRRDMSLVVAELHEVRAERERVAADPERIPLLQVHDLDYSYGPVQVLFGCSLEVHRGEVLALLGTNGAGKSTLLRAIAGLGVPDRGVVRLNGRTITYTPAELRYRQGVVVVRGGRVFPDLTVRENLELFVSRSARGAAQVEDPFETVFRVFPVLRERLHDRAAELSGGQRQMLALALALVQRPQLLIVDELSLGLAPVVVQELVAVVARLRAEGVTMIIVEQSLSVALALADRAVFMEKGRVRFDGPAAELAARDDLARAVFLGGEGG